MKGKKRRDKEREKKHCQVYFCSKQKHSGERLSSQGEPKISLFRVERGETVSSVLFLTARWPSSVLFLRWILGILLGCLFLSRPKKTMVTCPKSCVLCWQKKMWAKTASKNENLCLGKVLEFWRAGLCKREGAWSWKTILQHFRSRKNMAKESIYKKLPF